MAERRAVSAREVLARSQIFGALTGALIDTLVASGREVACAADDIVCAEGERSDRMYVIVEGRVRVFKTDPDDGTQVDIATLDAGEVVGELAMLDNKPRSATAVCEGPCRLFVLHRRAFMDALVSSESQEGVFAVFRALVERVRTTSASVYAKELERRTLRAKMEAEQHRAMAELVAGVAHEMNTPLGVARTGASILMHRVAELKSEERVAELLAEDWETREVLDELEEATALIQKNILRAHTLVEDFKRVSVTHLIDDTQATPLRKHLAEVLDLFRLQARRSGLDIDVNDALDPDDPAVWVGPPGRLTQVVMNLLTNIDAHAYDAAADAKPVTITLARCAASAEHFVLTVQDHGAGMDAETRAQIFVPFFTTARGRGGTGLGLSIVHNLVVSGLGGTIQVDSAPGQGARFTVRLPAQAPETSP